MENPFESWAIIELFGRNKLAGQCSEQNIAGVNMLRVDVPETPTNPKFTRFIGGASIYAINPVTKEVAEAMAQQLCVRPIHEWDIREFQKKVRLQLEERSEDRPTHDDFDDV